jgi:hypothetical protein
MTCRSIGISVKDYVKTKLGHEASKAYIYIIGSVAAVVAFAYTLQVILKSTTFLNFLL